MYTHVVWRNSLHACLVSTCICINIYTMSAAGQAGSFLGKRRLSTMENRVYMFIITLYNQDNKTKALHITHTLHSM